MTNELRFREVFVFKAFGTSCQEIIEVFHKRSDFLILVGSIICHPLLSRVLNGTPDETPWLVSHCKALILLYQMRLIRKKESWIDILVPHPFILTFFQIFLAVLIKAFLVFFRLKSATTSF